MGACARPFVTRLPGGEESFPAGVGAISVPAVTMCAHRHGNSAMRYVSTRGATEALDFQDAVLTGLAPDGGLLVPERIPDLSGDLDSLAPLSFVALAKRLLPRFIDDIPISSLENLVDAAYRTFSHPEVVRLENAGDIPVLELFHGPTLAFKDVALQLLGRLFDHILKQRGQRLNILGATSGDTGSAAIAGVRGRPGIDIFVMYPQGRISPLQELQMTTITDENVHCIAVEGSFDDCQRLMKSAFGDLEFKSRYALGSINSVNWARVLAQIVYYAYASLQLPAPVSFCVPTGNFGNIFAGYLARRMGFPIHRLVLATNENDILSVFFRTGLYRRGQVHFTVSPSMDIQVASNLERFLYYHLGEDSTALLGFMEAFDRTGEARLAPPGDDVFLATAVDTPNTMAAIRQVYRETGYVADPHTAVGLAAARRIELPGTVACLATAHPAKFPEAVDEAIGQPVARHPALESLKNRPSRRTAIPANIDAVKGLIRERAPAATG